MSPVSISSRASFFLGFSVLFIFHTALPLLRARFIKSVAPRPGNVSFADVCVRQVRNLALQVPDRSRGAALADECQQAIGILVFPVSDLFPEKRKELNSKVGAEASLPKLRIRLQFRAPEHLIKTRRGLSTRMLGCKRQTRQKKTKHVKIWKQGTRRGPGLRCGAAPEYGTSATDFLSQLAPLGLQLLEPHDHHLVTAVEIK